MSNYISAITDSNNQLYEIKDSLARNELSNVSRVSLIKDDIQYSKDLSVIRVDSDEYYNLISTDNVSESAIYLIENIDGDFDVLGLRIINVLDPIYYSDAATKQYVDDTIDNNISVVNDSINDSINDINDRINIINNVKADISSLPVVNNGLLYIRRNGSTIATFGANSSTNLTANINACTSITMNSSTKNVNSSGTIALGNIATNITLNGSTYNPSSGTIALPNMYSKTEIDNMIGNLSAIINSL